jgi:hypothetical protein
MYHQSAEFIYFARRPEITQQRFAHGIFRRGNESAIDEGGGRIVLGDDTDGDAIMQLPIRFQRAGTLYLNLCTRVHIQVAILRVLDCIVTILFGVYLVLWLF